MGRMIGSEQLFYSYLLWNTSSFHKKKKFKKETVFLSSKNGSSAFFIISFHFSGALPSWKKYFFLFLANSKDIVVPQHNPRAKRALGFSLY